MAGTSSRIFGLFAPYWKASARSAILGLTRYATKAHIARAVWRQRPLTREMVEAMEKFGHRTRRASTDGGMVRRPANAVQADISISRSASGHEGDYALGAMYAAGLAVGYYRDLDDLRATWSVDKTWTPKMPAEKRERMYRIWKKAVTRTFDWMDDSAS
jgi:glycerol kinase